MVHLTALLATLLLTTTTIVAHPGVHEPENLSKRNALWNNSKRSLADCASTLKGHALAERAIARRAALADKLRLERGIDTAAPYARTRRDLATSLATNHNKTGEIDLSSGVSSNIDPSVLFSGNTSCILAPEVTQGPYYILGEYVRTDIRDDEPGVPLYLDLQFIDTTTCEPVPSIFMDVWHANSTGVYSGIVASGNGDDSDKTNLDKTFLRGLQKTDEDGVSQFLTIFPGHYVDRTTHIHVVAHQGGQQNANGTFSGGNITHVGQLFFDESIRAEVELNEPYSSNTQIAITNAEDTWASSAADNDFDPFVKYVYLGDDVSDGLLAWISIGIDSTTVQTGIEGAATLTEDGGVVNEGFSLDGMNGTMPSGSISSGAVPSGTATPNA